MKSSFKSGVAVLFLAAFLAGAPSAVGQPRGHEDPIFVRLSDTARRLWTIIKKLPPVQALDQIGGPKP